MKLSSTFIFPPARPDNDEEDSSQVGSVHFVRTFGRLSNVFLRRPVGIGSDKLAGPAKTPFDVASSPSPRCYQRLGPCATVFATLRLPLPSHAKISLLLLTKRRGQRITPAIEQTTGVYLAIRARGCPFFPFFFLSMESRFFGVWIDWQKCVWSDFEVIVSPSCKCLIFPFFYIIFYISYFPLKRYFKLLQEVYYYCYYYYTFMRKLRSWRNCWKSKNNNEWTMTNEEESNFITILCN